MQHLHVASVQGTSLLTQASINGCAHQFCIRCIRRWSKVTPFLFRPRTPVRSAGNATTRLDTATRSSLSHNRQRLIGPSAPLCFQPVSSNEGLYTSLSSSTPSSTVWFIRPPATICCLREWRSRREGTRCPCPARPSSFLLSDVYNYSCINTPKNVSLLSVASFYAPGEGPLVLLSSLAKFGGYLCYFDASLEYH